MATVATLATVMTTRSAARAGGWFLALCALASAQEPAAQSDDERRGLILRTPAASPGFTLFCPFGDTTTYLIDLDGKVVKTWASAYRPGLSAYLLPDGKLLRGIQVEAEVPFDAGGDAGGLQLFSWDGALIWEFHLASTLGLLHHDFEPLLNGNVLVIARETRTREEVRDAGRLPDAIGEQGMWPCVIWEIEPQPPVGARVVWEWRVWDHLIQDVDPGLPHYGSVADRPERININADIPRAQDELDPGLSPEERAKMEALGYLAAGDDVDDDERERRRNPDWIHLNAIDWHPALDQIAVSTPRLSEVWIIDHSTTSEEARGSSGGRSGKGGDLLYRWGNPRTWQRGGNAARQLFFQHDVQWVPEGWPGAGNLTIFNNGRQRPGGDRSCVVEIAPPLQADGSYAREPDAAFGPATPCWSYDPDGDARFYASFISGAHRTRNGNTLVCSGPDGRLFEVTPAGELAWEYRVPYAKPRRAEGSRSPYGLFRATRIDPDHPALVAALARDARALDPLEPQPKTHAELEAELAATAPPSTSGWQPLFDEELGLSRWVAVNVAGRSTFTIVPDPDADGEVMVRCSGKPTGILRSDRMYENFVCEFEWRHAVEPGNAGFFVWSDPLPAQGGPFARSVEVQVCNLGNGDWFTSHGDLFPIWGATMTPDPRFRISGSRSMPREDAFHARPTGEWNHYRVTCLDGAITLEVNGHLVTAGSGCSPSKGYLCLESEGTEVDFRRMRIWELPAGTHAAGAERTAAAAGRHAPLYDGLDLPGDAATRKGEWQAQDWRLTCSAAEAELAIPLEQGVAELLLDFKRAAPPASGELPLRLGTQRFAMAGEKQGEWNRVRIVVRPDAIDVELNGTRQSLPREPGEPVRDLRLVNDAQATEFCSLFATR